ncbi:MAG: HpcH/HpaI aldolase/citrate lyase family protein [Acidobacteriota bacterium]
MNATPTLRERVEALLEARRAGRPPLEPRLLAQPAHLTCPATVWKYVEGAVAARAPSLVMLDLEDSIPRGDAEALRLGQEQTVRALRDLDWGRKLRFFRPRGLALDPGFEDVLAVVPAAGAALEGLVYPKVEGPEEVALLDEALAEAEARAGLAEGHVKVELLVESVLAEERLDDIAAATGRLAGLIFGAFDYWGSMGLRREAYRPDHPLVMDARVRIAKAAARAGVPAIAEMTLTYPTKNKPEAERRAALEECRRDAELARDCGFSGKWTGMPAQAEVVLEVFRLPQAEIDAAVAEVRAYAEAERAGRGAVMIGGRMADRATDRINRALLERAHALGQLPEAIARELLGPSR